MLLRNLFCVSKQTQTCVYWSSKYLWIFPFEREILKRCDFSHNQKQSKVIPSVPSSHLKTEGDQSFSVAAPKLFCFYCCFCSYVSVRMEWKWHGDIYVTRKHQWFISDCTDIFLFQQPAAKSCSDQLIGQKLSVQLPQPPGDWWEATCFQTIQSAIWSINTDHTDWLPWVSLQ